MAKQIQRKQLNSFQKIMVFLGISFISLMLIMVASIVLLGMWKALAFVIGI